jgi:hypothetical protein
VDSNSLCGEKAATDFGEGLCWLLEVTQEFCCIVTLDLSGWPQNNVVATKEPRVMNSLQREGYTLSLPVFLLSNIFETRIEGKAGIFLAL